MNSSQSAYSIQQINFEFRSYIKHFGADPRQWQTGCCADPESELFHAGYVDRLKDIWIWKPAVSPRAAAHIFDVMTRMVRVLPQLGAGPLPSTRIVFLYRKMPVESLDASADSVTRPAPRSRMSAQAAKLPRAGIAYADLRKRCLEAICQWPGCETVAGIQLVRTNSASAFVVKITLYGQAEKKTADRAKACVEREMQRRFRLTE
jgi:hypothetical protein